MFKVEEGNLDDYKQINRIMWRAFEIENKFDEEKSKPWEEWIKEGYSRSFVIKENNNLIANLTLEKLPAYIRGSDIIVSGVGAVATEPTHRGKGMVKALFKKAFQSMRDEGEILSMLDPFNIEFYRKFGYACAERMIQYRFESSNIAKLKIPDTVFIREAGKKDSSILMDLQYSSIRNGSRVFLTNSNIEKKIKSLNCYIVQDGDTPIGWFKLYFHRDKSQIDWDRQKLTLTVSLALFYNNATALNAMFNFLGKFGGHAHNIRVNCSKDVPVQHYIVDRSKLIVEVEGSMMIRIIDIHAYVKKIKIPKAVTESIIISLEDEHCSWNSGTYLLNAQNEELTIEPTSSKPDIIVSDQQFSRIISGLSRSEIMQSIGIIDCSPVVAKKLDLIFPLDSVLSYIRF